MSSQDEIVLTYKDALFSIVTGSILVYPVDVFTEIFIQMLKGTSIDMNTVDVKEIEAFYHKLCSIDTDYESSFFNLHFQDKMFQVLILGPNFFGPKENRLMRCFYRRGLNQEQKSLLNKYPHFDEFLFQWCSIRMQGKMKHFIEMYDSMREDMISSQMDESELIGMKLKDFRKRGLISSSSTSNLQTALTNSNPNQLGIHERQLYDDYVSHFNKYGNSKIRQGIIFGIGLFENQSVIRVSLKKSIN